jgi:hypothetical protein
MKKIVIISLLVAIVACSCNDTLDIQQKYSFELYTMPVPKRIKQGETVEIRCQLVKEGNYTGAKFQIRYFQPDGKGDLIMDGRRFLPNDLYSLTKDVFRLYYTSQCDEQQVIDVYIEDSFGQVVRRTFSFSPEKEEKEKEE